MLHVAVIHPHCPQPYLQKPKMSTRSILPRKFGRYGGGKARIRKRRNENGKKKKKKKKKSLSLSLDVH
ncbi:hypothetical protein ACN38_g8695 [Penicillium nordicum]|uniref:Uncharacterized protein n=1 Tax=Penicillium nordicum TaxID=229535 RepID=A0A0M9WDA5_9EURO|nr:hypothetical protein ACN38_g8695 [Penicillium nordicum]